MSKEPKAAIEHTGSKEWGDGEYLVCAPDGYRFEGLDCHELVVAYGENDLTRAQGYQLAREERRDHQLEPCPPDCHCLE